MLVIGLTGSIASGKSSASRILSLPPHALPIIDADVIARKVVEPGTSGYEKIKKHFLSTTPDLLNADGSLNRPALGRRVFGDSPERVKDRAVLNGIVHPAVRREMIKEVLLHWIKGYWAVVLDVPLLLEGKLDMLCGTVILIDCPDPEMQVQRILKRNREVENGNMTEEEARGRIASQMQRADKVEILEKQWVSRGKGHIIRNDGTLQDMERNLGDTMDRIREGRGSLWTYSLLFVPVWTLARTAWIVFQNWRSKKIYTKNK